jgi:quinohemoprotein ethanol dehydrogenase
VFQGAADGRFVAYNATSGEKLWESPTGTGIVAGPATYMIDGVQYVSVAVGWGGVFGEFMRATDNEGPGTVFTFAAGGKAPPLNFTKYQMAGLLEGVKYDPANVEAGTLLCQQLGFCHGVPGVDKAATKNRPCPDRDIANLKDFLLQRSPGKLKGDVVKTGLHSGNGRNTAKKKAKETEAVVKLARCAASAPVINGGPRPSA